MPDVIIVGGGVAGLAAAYETTRRGLDTVLLEASPRIGGTVRTDRVDGCVIDAGPDGFLAQKPGALQLCRELGLADRLIATIPPRTACVLKAGRLEPLPDPSFFGIPATRRSLEETGLLSPAAKERVAAEPSVAPGLPDESLGAFVRRRFGTEVVDWIVEPLLAGIHAGDVDRLSVDALFPALREAERHPDRVLGAAAARASAADPEGAFRSLAGGMGELIDALRGALGAVLRTAATVTTIARKDRYLVTLRSGESLSADAVILATPAHTTARLLEPLDPVAATLCAQIRYESSVVVVLSYARAQIGRAMIGSGFVVPRHEPGLGILAATWITSKWPHRAPDDRVLMRAFLGGARDPDCLDSADEALTATAMRDLAAVMEIAGAPQWSRVYRWPLANPQYEVGHLARVAAIDARLAACPGLHLTGSGFRAIGLPDVITDARAAATAVAEERDR